MRGVVALGAVLIGLAALALAVVLVQAAVGASKARSMRRALARASWRAVEEPMGMDTVRVGIALVDPRSGRRLEYREVGTVTSRWFGLQALEVVGKARALAAERNELEERAGG